jgi:hypothetical protein
VHSRYSCRYNPDRRDTRLSLEYGYAIIIHQVAGDSVSGSDFA